MVERDYSTDNKDLHVFSRDGKIWNGFWISKKGREREGATLNEFSLSELQEFIKEGKYHEVTVVNED